MLFLVAGSHQLISWRFVPSRPFWCQLSWFSRRSIYYPTRRLQERTTAPMRLQYNYNTCNISSCAAMRMGSDEQGLVPGGRLSRLAFNSTSHYFFLRSNAQSVGQTRTTDSERKYDAEDDELHGKCVQSSEMPEKSLPILLELYVSSKNCRIMTYVGSNESWGPQLHAAPHEKALRSFRAATDRSMHAPFRGATHVRDSALALFDRSCHVTEVPTTSTGRCAGRRTDTGQGRRRRRTDTGHGRVDDELHTGSAKRRSTRLGNCGCAAVSLASVGTSVNKSILSRPNSDVGATDDAVAGGTCSPSNTAAIPRSCSSVGRQ